MNTQSKAQQLIASIREAEANIDAIQQFWKVTIGLGEIRPRQASIWLNIYGFDIVVDGIKAAAIWLNKHSQTIDEAVIEPKMTDEQFNQVLAENKKDGIDLIKYASGCMKNARLRAQDKANGK